MKSSDERTWSIGEVAERFGMPTHVLRHWESVGLLDPARDTGGRRRYGVDDVTRVATIRRSRASGMSLERIGVLLDGQAPGRHAVLEEHIAELDTAMEQMAASRAMTEHALRCRAHDITTCPRFQAHLQDLLTGF